MIEVTEDTFQEKILNSNKTVVTLFYTTYCPFVRDFKPIFKKYSQNSDDEYALVDITDDNNPLWDKCNVAKVPTILVFKEGQEIGRRNAIPGVGLIERDMQGLLNDI
ncbi:MAG: thioredoxin family protein [Nitrososphaerales archaeon]|jgi:thioredoxin 1|nr:thioredoxin family protein [Nitrososphaerales archaeon]|tara:strand:- start:759 stop:1079 length:321 start_codon:yes stop_codon:yes gene_type:complete